jgi:hypothetical protein
VLNSAAQKAEEAAVEGVLACACVCVCGGGGTWGAVCVL